MTWPQTGLAWHPTSPNIPTLDSVAGYPMTGLGAQMGKFKHGIGTAHPFRFLTFEGVDPSELKAELDSIGLAGLSFQLKTLTNSNGIETTGVYIVISDWKAWRPTDLAFHMMRLSAKWEQPSPFTQAKESEITLFNKHVGSVDWWNQLSAEGSAVGLDSFFGKWDRECQNFRSLVSSFLLY